MNKKGFTLVELLGVIIIISVVIAIVYPSVSEILKQSKKTIKNVQIDKILNAAYDFTLKNTDFLPEVGETKYLTLNQLKKENLIDSDIKEANTEKSFSEDLVISIKNTNSSINVSENSKLNGNYLYTVEFEFMNTDKFNNNKPTIDFEGYDVNPIVINLNIGDVYVPIKYTANSADGKNLTGEVVENIICNSKKSNKVDTSTAGIYFLNYTVVDSNGYSNLYTINVIVSDTEMPNLVIPDNETISKSLNSYDFMKGVSCTDNSGTCDIKVNGEINFGIEGKYIIEYMAFDPSGNTRILKRVITVQ